MGRHETVHPEDVNLSSEVPRSRFGYPPDGLSLVQTLGPSFPLSVTPLPLENNGGSSSRDSRGTGPVVWTPGFLSRTRKGVR